MFWKEWRLNFTTYSPRWQIGEIANLDLPTFDKTKLEGTFWKVSDLFCKRSFQWKYPLVHLLNELNASGKIHSKVDESPFDTLPSVLLLFQYEHVVIEELLQLLVCEVDAELLEAVILATKARMQSNKSLTKWHPRRTTDSYK